MDSIKDLRPNVPADLTINESMRKEIDVMIKACNAFSHLTNQSIFLIDYTRQEFLYVSPHPLFLCGYELEEVKAMGLSFYGKILPPDDLQMFLETFKKSWRFFHDDARAPEDREHSSLSYDIHFRHKNGDVILVNQKTTPLFFTDDGNLWIGMVVIGFASHKEAGYYVYRQKNKNQYFRYDFDKKKLVAYVPEKLTKREEEILRFSMQGYNETGIANKLHLSVRTVRNHCYNAKKKLNVNNLANAVSKFNLIF